jgi:hypothetical protein
MMVLLILSVELCEIPRLTQLKVKLDEHLYRTLHVVLH